MWFLKIPPQAEIPGLPFDAPSILHFNRLFWGGCHKTSLVTGAFGWWIVHLKALRIVKSTMELLDTLEVWLPERDVEAITIEIVDFQWMPLLLNLAWFLACQMMLIKLAKAALITTLQPYIALSHTFQMSSLEEKLKAMLMVLASQFKSLVAKWHSKKRWKADSDDSFQRLNIDGMLQPLIIKFSSVGTLLCINLQTKSDLAGGMSLLHMNFAQCYVPIYSQRLWKLLEN